MSDEYVIEMKGISRRFGSVQALDNVDLELRRGEVLGLVGDNAAGKSTLMRILAGALAPDEGEILVGGHPVTFHTPRHAQSLGISMIYQDLALFNNLDVATNMSAGREPTRSILGIRFMDKRKMHLDARQMIDRLNVDIKATSLLVEKMSGGQRQMVACGRAIGSECKVLIMDEPTAALGVKEVGTLLKLITDLKNQGLSIILITHRLPDLLAIGSRVIVLKGGQRQGMLEIDKCSLDDIESLIVRGRAKKEDQTSSTALEKLD